MKTLREIMHERCKEFDPEILTESRSLGRTTSYTNSAKVLKNARRIQSELDRAKRADSVSEKLDHLASAVELLSMTLTALVLLTHSIKKGR